MPASARRCFVTAAKLVGPETASHRLEGVGLLACGQSLLPWAPEVLFLRNEMERYLHYLLSNLIYGKELVAPEFLTRNSTHLGCAPETPTGVCRPACSIPEIFRRQSLPPP